MFIRTCITVWYKTEKITVEKVVIEYVAKAYTYKCTAEPHKCNHLWDHLKIKTKKCGPKGGCICEVLLSMRLLLKAEL